MEQKSFKKKALDIVFPVISVLLLVALVISKSLVLSIICACVFAVAFFILYFKCYQYASLTNAANESIKFWQNRFQTTSSTLDKVKEDNEDYVKKVLFLNETIDRLSKEIEVLSTTEDIPADEEKNTSLDTYIQGVIDLKEETPEVEIEAVDVIEEEPKPTQKSAKSRKKKS